MDNSMENVSDQGEMKVLEEEKSQEIKQENDELKTKINNNSLEVFRESRCSKFKKNLFESQEVVIVLALQILPFISISYVNFVNWISGLILLVYLFNVTSASFFRAKRSLLFALLILNFLDILFRIIMVVLFLKEVLDKNTWAVFNEYFLIYPDDTSKLSYHLLISFLLFSLLLIYNIFKSCRGGEDFTDELIFNLKTLKKLHGIKYFLLFFSFLLICVSASLHQNIIFLCMVTLVIFNLFTWVFRFDRFRKKLHKLSSVLVMLTVMLVLVVEYLFNLRDLYQMFSIDLETRFLPNLIGVVFFSDEKLPEKDEKCKICCQRIFSILILNLVLFLIVLYINSRTYKNRMKNCNQKKENPDQVQKKKIINQDTSQDDIYYISSINNTNQNILIILDEKKLGFFEKLRVIIRNYVYSPYFIMHFCRIGVIVWFSYFKSYTSIVIILWLFRSFTIKISRDIYIFTTYIVFPLLILTTYFAYVVNIAGVEIIKINESNQTLIAELGLTKYDQEDQAFAAIFIRLLVTYVFGIFIHIHKNKDLISGPKEKDILVDTSLNLNDPNSESKNELISDKDHNQNNISAISDPSSSGMNNLKEPFINFKINDIDLNTSNLSEEKKENLKESDDLSKSNSENKSTEKKLIQIHEGFIRDKLVNEKIIVPKEDKSKKYTLKVSEILLKIILNNIYKLSMLFIYLASYRSPNVFHFILAIVLFIQLSRPDVIRRYCRLFILIIELIVFTEYIWIFIEKKISPDETTKNILKFFFLEVQENGGSPNSDQLLWGALYCLYIEYQNYTSKIYEKYEKMQIDFYVYVNYHFNASPKFKKFLFLILDFLNEIYIWCLFFGFFGTLVFTSTSVLVCVKMITFFLVINRYLKTLENNYLEAERISRYLKALLLICVLITSSVYIYQFFQLDLVLGWYNDSIKDKLPYIISENAKLIGFEVYKNEMRPKFLPHVFSNILAVLISHEVKRIIHIKKNPTKNTASDNQSILRIRGGNAENQQEEGRNSYFNFENEKFQKIFYSIMFYILQYYWIGLFFFIFLFAVSWRLSITMLILIIIFLVRLIECFNQYFKLFKKNCKISKFKTSLNGMLRTYAQERQIHFKITQEYRSDTFNIIWGFLIVYIVFTYISSIVIDMKIFKESLDDKIVKDFLKSCAYIIGIYFSNDDQVNNSFLKSINGYFILLIMLIIEKYFQNKCFELNNKLNNNRKKVFKCEEEKSQIQEEKEINIPGNLEGNEEKSENKPEKNVNENENVIINFKKINDPLSLGDKENGEKKFQTNKFKTDLKKFFEDPETHTPIQNKDKTKEGNENQKENFKRAKSFKLSTILDTDENIHNKDDVFIHEEEFEFPNIFAKKRSVTEYGKNFKSLSQLNNQEGEQKSSHSDNEENQKDNNEINEAEITFKEEKKEEISVPEPTQIGNQLNSEEEEEMDRRRENYNRRRKNASYVKEALVRYSLEFQVGVKKLLEEVILFLILLSAFIKLNILSFVYFFLVMCVYKGGNKLKSFFYLASCFMALFIIQYTLFTTNLSSYTDLEGNTLLLELLKSNLAIPWYESFCGIKWGFFFSLGVSNFQINSLWMDFVIIMVIYFYLDSFTYAIFENAFASNSSKLSFEENEASYKRLQSFSYDEYERFKKSMKISFDIDIQDINLDNQKNLKTSSLPIVKKASLKENIKMSLANQEITLNTDKKPKNKLLVLYKLIKKYIYLTFHNVTLILILIFSMMNNGLISIPYIIFSVVYIYKTHNFLVGNDWTFQHAIKFLLKPLLFLDLMGALIYQVPFEFFILHKSSINKAMGILGFEIIIRYNSPGDMINLRPFTLALLKIVTYLLVSIQEIIYNSSDFKVFILKYHLKMKEKSKLNGKLHAFIFNNSRIQLMKQRLKERKNIDDTLTRIELQLNKWNEKFNFHIAKKSSLINNISSSSKPQIKVLNRKRNLAIHKKDTSSAFNLINLLEKQNTLKKKLDDLSIKKVIMRDWLVKICIYLHEQSTLLLGTELFEENNVERILKGHMNIESKLEEAIEAFEKENEHKYTSLKMMMKKRDSLDNLHVPPHKDDEKRSVTSVISEESQEDEDQTGKTFEKKTSVMSIVSVDTNNMQESKQDEKEEILESTEYYEVEFLIKTDFFKNFCSKWKMLQFIFFNILRYFAQNFDYICYFFMIINHMVYCSALSVVWPLLVFCAGIIAYPKPRKSFWNFSIFYCGFVICFKFILQISLWYLFFETKVTPDADGDFHYKDYLRIGIVLFDTTFSKKFVKYIIFDFLLMCILIAHQFMLIRKGLWNVIEPDLESVEEAYDRINKFNTKDDFVQNVYFDASTVDTAIINKKKLSYSQRLKNYYKELFPRLRNEKPGKDFYIYYTIFQMTLIVYIIFFYTKMDQDTTVYNEDTIQLKQFSGNMVIFSFLHVFLVVLERFIYLKNSRKVNRRTYKVYDTYTGEEIDRGVSFDKSKARFSIKTESLLNYEKNERYEIVYFQTEDLLNGLIYKYILQIIIVFITHVFIFWYLPFRGNYNLHNSSICEVGIDRKKLCNDFGDNSFVIIFYILYCVYFLFSGLQIKYSMIDMRKKSALMKGDNLFYSSVFKTFKAMPFLYELKLLIDWTFTETALDLWKWLKFEAIYDLLFITKCNMKSYYGRRLGTRVSKLDKFFSGGLFFFLMLIIVFGPLVLFSSLNPTNKQNMVLGTNTELQISFVKNKIALNYTLFKSSQLQAIDMISDDQWKENSFDQIVETKNYEKKQVQVVKMLKNSEKNWEISDASFNFILDMLKSPKDYQIYLNLKYSFLRDLSSKNNVEDYYFISSFQIYPQETKVESSTFIEMRENLLNCNQQTFKDNAWRERSFTVNKFYNPAVRLSSSLYPSIMTSDVKNWKDVEITLKCNSQSSYWAIKLKGQSGLIFYTFSDLISPTSESYDVLTFYVTFILIIGKFVRSIISGEAERVIYTEMPRPHKLLIMCEGIKISRYKKDLVREDRLYYVLIDLLRSPEMLKMITKSSLVFTQSTVTQQLDEEKGLVPKKRQTIIKKSSIRERIKFNDN